MIDTPDTELSASKVFGIDCDWKIPAFKERTEHVPDVDETYQFDSATTRAILAGFVYNRRVLIQGYHGTGKSTHIEQVAARLNWPTLRVNMDSHISRIDLVGRDAIVVKDGQQITEFREGILPWALQRPVALVFDEYDAARPDVMFVIQRVLEAQGKLTLLDQNRVITPHPLFRIFATTNTVGLGDASGLYHGTQALNQGQMDRWNIVTQLNYLPEAQEVEIILAKAPKLKKKLAKQMVVLANLTRESFKAGDISTVMSPRTVILWAENIEIFENREDAFTLTFLNKCDEEEKPVIAELYQRVFDVELV
ncbi:MAG: AAA family ATPase [Rickettsiales bacterium]|nr:AAA family ATPase [Rickettsiales bacterium]